MKRKNREINIFSMSALDLFASAMGAFLLIAVMALPYYLKTDHDLLQQINNLKNEINNISQKISKIQAQNKILNQQKRQLQAQNNTLEQQKRRLQAQNKTLEQQKRHLQAQNKTLEQQKRHLQAQNRKIQKELSKTFCVIKLSWKSSDKEDVDLHITDPDGREYSFKKTSYHGSSASLSVDSKNVKKGAEVWIDKELKPGVYTITYVYYSGSGNVRVTGMVLTKSFTKDLPVKNLHRPNKTKKIKVATITVDANGNASLETF